MSAQYARAAPRAASSAASLPIIVRIDGDSDILQGTLQVSPATTVAQTRRSIEAIVHEVLQTSAHASRFPHLTAAQLVQCDLLDDSGHSMAFEQLARSRRGPEEVCQGSAISVLVAGGRAGTSRGEADVISASAPAPARPGRPGVEMDD